MISPSNSWFIGGHKGTWGKKLLIKGLYSDCYNFLVFYLPVSLCFPNPLCNLVSPHVLSSLPLFQQYSKSISNYTQPTILEVQESYCINNIHRYSIVLSMDVPNCINYTSRDISLDLLGHSGVDIFWTPKLVGHALEIMLQPGQFKEVFNTWGGFKRWLYRQNCQWADIIQTCHELRS